MNLDNHPTGVKEGKRVRAGKALELRIAGGSYRQIARQLSISERTAYKDVQGELARLDVLKRDSAERLREIELERLDRATVGLSAAVGQGDPRAVMAMVKVMERRAKLLGLDAPTQNDHTFSGGPIPLTFTLTLDRPPVVIEHPPIAPALIPAHVGGNGNGNGAGHA